MQVFIDTNIYLDYFRENSKERLTPLSELDKILKKKKVNLLLPDQVRLEFYKKRKSVAAETRKLLKKQGDASFIVPPTFDTEREDIQAILKQRKILSGKIKEALKTYDKEILGEKTDADILLKKVFKKAKVIKDNKGILDKAHKRYLRGLPPRKSDYSYGDSIIWETLLEKGNKDRLVVITRDSDFVEEYNEEKKIHTLLEEEWVKSKGKPIDLYVSLGEFVKTLDKKSKIKKEVIEQEKHKPLVEDYIIEQSISNNHFGFASEDTLLQPLSEGVRGALLVDWDDVKGSALSSVDPKYCPYCGKKLTNSLLFLETAIGGRVTCGGCGNNFKIS